MRNSSVSLLAVALGCALAVSSLRGQSEPDLRVLSREGGSVVVEYTPLFLSPQTETEQGMERVNFAFYGATLLPGTPGTPIVAFRPAVVYFPSSRFAVSILSSEFEELPNMRPALHPRTETEDEWTLVRVPTDSPQPEKILDPIPSTLAEVVDVAHSGALVQGTLRLYPVEILRAGAGMRIYKRIVVRLDFDPWDGDIFSGASGVDGSLPVAMRTEGAQQDSPFAQGVWYRMEVTETGIYKLDQQFFSRAGIALSSIGDIQSIRIFGNGGKEIPEDLQAPRAAGLEEVTRHVIDVNRNGRFDAEDCVLFYGASTRGWNYDPQRKTFNHYINHYAETNYYFLTFAGPAGMQMDSIASTNVEGAYVPPDFQGKLFVEEELFNGINSGRQWVGRSFDDGSRTVTFTNLLPGLVSNKPIAYRFVFLSRSTTVDTFRVQENDRPLGSPVLMFPIDVRSIENVWQYVSPVITMTGPGNLPNDRSVLRITFGPGNSGARGWIDWLEILYRQRHEAVNDFLLFSSPDTSAVVEYQLSRFTSRDVHVFDVSEHSNVRRVTNLAFNAADVSSFRFQVAQSAGSVRHFAAVGPGGFKSPGAVTRISNSNLHGTTPGADFVIVAPQEFFAAANRLKAHRERPGMEYLKTEVVDVAAIFNEFGGGLRDPMAIRDFLRYARTAWTIKPRYVLLLGDGSFDYKDNLGRKEGGNWIPPYESLNSVHQIGTYSSDDHFVLLEPGNPRVSMALGRLPVRNAGEASLAVEKIIAYEESAPFGSWRNRVTFVADDGLTSTADEGSLHTGQADELARLHTPDSFEKKKIYIVEYPTVTGATGRRKPDANRAIVEALNNGTLIINYTGHGNPRVWAHEWIFTDDEISRLTNDAFPSLFVAATCDYARWDYPLEQSAGERLLVSMRGGAIGVMTSIRVVYSHLNAQFNNTWFRALLVRDSLGRPPRLGDAMKATKQILYSLNDLKFHLLADPTMRLAAPRAVSTIDSLAGRPTTQMVTVPTLGKVEFSGTVQQPDGRRWESFAGRALVEVFDAKRRVVVPEWQNFFFEVNGSLLYRGEVSVNGGLFRGVFPIPKDVSYDTNPARISVYAWSTSTDGVGFTENFRIEGTDTAAVADTTGPVIRIYLDSDAFRPGDMVKPDATLIVDLFDESGINTSTAGIGHRLEAVLLSTGRKFDLTEYYRGNLDTYQSGRVEYPLTELPEGRNRLAVKAWDIHNNSSQAETYFEVRSATDGSIFNVLNFPNPFSNRTVFTFQRNSSEPVDVEIKVYTLAGRLVETLHAYAVTDRFVQLPWEGRDRDGQELANGVYLYKVLVRSLDRSAIMEVLGKLSVLR